MYDSCALSCKVGSVQGRSQLEGGWAGLAPAQLYESPLRRPSSMFHTLPTPAAAMHAPAQTR